MGMFRTAVKRAAIVAALVMTKRVASRIIHRAAHRHPASPAKT